MANSSVHYNQKVHLEPLCALVTLSVKKSFSTEKRKANKLRKCHRRYTGLSQLSQNNPLVCSKWVLDAICSWKDWRIGHRWVASATKTSSSWSTYWRITTYRRTSGGSRCSVRRQRLMMGRVRIVRIEISKCRRCRSDQEKFDYESYRSYLFHQFSSN